MLSSSSGLISSISMEAFWLAQVFAYYYYTMHKELYMYKLQALSLAFAWIILGDIAYYTALHFHANFIATMTTGCIVATLQIFAPKLAPKIMKDNDPLSEKVQRLCRMTAAIGAALYLGIFIVAPKTTVESMMSGLIPNVNSIQAQDDGTGQDNPLGDMIPGIDSSGHMSQEDAAKLIGGVE